ncbi:bifunctional precorrin-2 dehydrogenase/sirohydrochlorin ferrochelatase [Paenibacillus nanensis]|uniref:precorrin-2 dehydrogenase n=1 Tax=Paenibacillus nanensis TaxID=393251 RepID=A0A3A1UPQ8_9BACL|nr:bifunctional precorrin-2 dehydrogenase/sirohydrochlorin ferrochelatase [Paenibacillus nanensis]RIX50529.1 bifunctional precorrin-2 dehydrogenase/sirohydrochlorin ferrochelatase [Paenibacillus nanensis]
MEKNASNGYYPVALKMAGKRCLVAGGGKVAERKLMGLLEAGADRVVLISPAVTEAIQKLSDIGAIEWLPRACSVKSDLSGAWLVIAATNDRELNAAIAEEAERLGILSNIADDYERGSFITPSVIRKGRLLISVTATGASPVFAKAVSRELESRYGQRYADALERLNELRRLAQEKIEDRMLKEKVLRLAADECLTMKHSMGHAEDWLHRLIDRTKGGLQDEQQQQ